MAFVPPVMLIRRNHIISRLKKHGAVSPEKAKTFSEVGVINPDRFVRLTEILLKRGVIRKTEDGKFYLI